MNEVLSLQWWSEKVEEYLSYACEAEESDNDLAAEMLFRKALFFEAFLRGDLYGIKEYTTLA